MPVLLQRNSASPDGEQESWKSEFQLYPRYSTWYQAVQYARLSMLRRFYYLHQSEYGRQNRQVSHLLANQKHHRLE